MYIANGIAYANAKMQEASVKAVKPLDDMMMIVTFGSGEKRLYDATQLLAFPAFQPLKDEKVFKNAKVEYGVVTWNNGEIDSAPETMYENSYEYPEMQVLQGKGAAHSSCAAPKSYFEPWWIITLFALKV